VRGGREQGRGGATSALACLVFVAACGRCGYDPFGAVADASRDLEIDGATAAVDAALTGDAAADALCAERCVDGTCVDGTCELSCGIGCDSVTCPDDVPCDVTCGLEACAAGVDCGNATTCTIHCAVAGACSGAIACGAATVCTVACSGSASCGGPIGCGPGRCAIDCSGIGSCAAQIDCSGSCGCDVACMLTSCGDMVTCPDGCAAGRDCTSAAAGCDAC
jgi:hypothetical protein